MPECRICNSPSKFQTIRADFVYGGETEHKFWHCSNCDAVYLYPAKTKEEEEYFYRQEFEKFMVSRSGTERDWSNPLKHIETNQDHVLRRMKILSRFLKPGLKLLEIGCSSGFMMDPIRELGIECTGIEPSEVFTEFLVKRNYKVYKDISELSENEKFDIITHFFVFEHIADPFQFLENTLKLLKTSGKIIAEIPCVNDPLTSVYNIPAFEKFYWSIAHNFYYSPECLRYIFDKMNLSYNIYPDQRYDLSNHIVWMTEGRGGGQNRFNNIFSKELIEKYKQDLINSWFCDTVFVEITKND